MYYLVKFVKDWADELTVEGFTVVDDEGRQRLLDLGESDREYTKYFGTNEGWEDEPISEFVDCMEFIEISDKEAEALSRLFTPGYLGTDPTNVQYGVFPEFEDEYSDDDMDEDE